MFFTIAEVGFQYFQISFVYDYLRLEGVPLFLSRVVFSLLFFGLWIGLSLASTTTVSIHALFTNSFLFGSLNSFDFIKISSIQTQFRKQVLSLILCFVAVWKYVVYSLIYSSHIRSLSSREILFGLAPSLFFSTSFSFKISIIFSKVVLFIPVSLLKFSFVKFWYVFIP